MPDIDGLLSDREMQMVREAAEKAGMTVDEFYSHAARTEFRSRVVLPKRNGKVLTFKGLKRPGKGT